MTEEVAFPPGVDRARALHEAGDYIAAADAYAAILGDHPQVPDFWRRIADDAVARGNLTDGRALLTRAVERRPGDPALYHALARAARVADDFSAAVAACRAAVRLQPSDAPAHVHLAECLFASGQWADGFEAFEQRLKVPEIALPSPPLPRWPGGDPAGRTILVAAEQGYGDTLQFCRFVPALAALGAHVVLAVPPPLHRLVAGLDGVAKVISRDADLPACDAWIPLLSLPGLLGMTPTEAPPPYLSAAAAPPPAAGGDALKVGIAWRGRAGSKAAKSPPDACIAALAKCPGVQLFGLQMDRRDDLGDAVPDLIADAADFADTAACVGALDLVIAADTAVAHLAGALGRPLWVMLAQLPDWRWQGGDGATPWYPAARLFRQPRVGDWQAVTADIGNALTALTS